MPLETIEVPRSNDVDKPDEIPFPRVENRPLNGASFEDTMDVMLDKELLIMLGSSPNGFPIADSDSPFLNVEENDDTLALITGNFEATELATEPSPPLNILMCVEALAVKPITFFIPVLKESKPLGPTCSTPFKAETKLLMPLGAARVADTKPLTLLFNPSKATPILLVSVSPDRACENPPASLLPNPRKLRTALA